MKLMPFVPEDAKALDAASKRMRELHVARGTEHLGRVGQSQNTASRLTTALTARRLGTTTRRQAYEMPEARSGVAGSAEAGPAQRFQLTSCMHSAAELAASFIPLVIPSPKGPPPGRRVCITIGLRIDLGPIAALHDT
jgi:hypothetical protein